MNISDILYLHPSGAYKPRNFPCSISIATSNTILEQSFNPIIEAVHMAYNPNPFCCQQSRAKPFTLICITAESHYMGLGA